MAEEFDSGIRKEMINKYQLDKYYIPLLLIGMEYGLSEEELGEYLSLKEQGLTAMHRKMMEVIFSAYKYDDPSEFRENRMEFICHFQKILQRHIDVEAMEAQKIQNSEDNVELNGGGREDEYRALRERLAALRGSGDGGAVTEGAFRKRLAALRIDGEAGETETAAFRERLAALRDNGRSGEDSEPSGESGNQITGDNSSNKRVTVGAFRKGLDHIRADQREWEDSVRQIANASKDAENSVRLATNAAKRSVDRRDFGESGVWPDSKVESGTGAHHGGSEVGSGTGAYHGGAEIGSEAGTHHGGTEIESGTGAYYDGADIGSGTEENNGEKESGSAAGACHRIPDVEGRTRADYGESGTKKFDKVGEGSARESGSAGGSVNEDGREWEGVGEGPRERKVISEGAGFSGQYPDAEPISGSADLYQKPSPTTDGCPAETIKGDGTAASDNQQTDCQKENRELKKMDGSRSKNSLEKKSPRVSILSRLTRKGRNSLEQEKVQREKEHYQRLTAYILEHTELDPQQISAVTYARDVGIPEDVIIRMLDEKADSQSIRNAATFYTFNHGR